jgi:4-hydroxy-2-oxoheptanedioate aldolase
MKMKTNYVRHKLRAGQPSFGTWLTLPDVTAAQLMTRMGFDWLTVEMEHAAMSIETAGALFAIISNAGVVPLVRVPINSTENIKRVLDIGAWGIVVPMVNSRAEAEAVVEAARYRPIGKRTVGGSLRGANFDTDPGTYYARANEEILVIIMAETAEAVENIEDICSVPGLDGVFIGPNDLHASFGLPPNFESDHTQFRDALERIRMTAKKHGLASGIHVADTAQAQRRAKEGFQFIAISSEAGFMMAKAKEVTSALGIGAGKAVAKY